MRRFLADIVRSFADLVYPPLCFHCQETLEVGNPTFCKSCLASLEPVDPTNRCPLCFSFEFNKELQQCCNACLKNSRIMKRKAAVFDYEGPAASLVKHLKYQGATYLAKGGGAYLAAQFLQLGWPMPDIVVPMPIARLRKWERGYNQSLLLAESFGSILNVPVKDLLTRRSGDFSQAGLNHEQRTQLSAMAFDLRKGADVFEKTILLIDDVMTTGSSLERCAERLHTHFPKAIYGLTLCRAM
jgi:ComF family protein